MSGFLGLLGALAPIAAPIVGGLFQNQATNAQVAGLNNAAAQASNALALQAQIFNQNRADLAPWRQYGASALAQFANALGPNFQASPGYQFALDQGLRAIQRSAAGRGMLDSGQTLKALMQYGQGLANQEYGNYLNRLAALSGIGQTAVGQGIGAANAFGSGAMQGSNLLANILADIGAAEGAGTMRMGNTLASGLNALSDYWTNAGGKKPGFVGY